MIINELVGVVASFVEAFAALSTIDHDKSYQQQYLVSCRYVKIMSSRVMIA